MSDIKSIINEEIMTTVANYPQFGDRLRSISEVGDASVPAYPFKFENTSFNEVNYYFDTEEDEYIVMVNNVDVHAGVWEMQFGTVGGTPDDVVDKGNMYQVLSTILEITNDFIDRFRPNILRFKPSKKKEEDKYNEKTGRKKNVDPNQRFNLYMEFIKKNMRQDYSISKYGDYIVFERKIKSNVPKI